MSIMVMGLFEAITASEESLFEWGHHADGAAALTQYRGVDEMLADPMSRKLYWSVRSQAVFSNIIKSEPLEPYLDWETLWLEPLDLPQDTPGVKLTALSSRVPALRAAAAKWFRHPMSGMVAMKCVDIIGNAKVLDQLLASWAFEVPSAWRPRVVGNVEGDLLNPEESFLYPGDLESHYDLWVGTLWNSWRTERVICNMLIVNGLERLLPIAQLHECPEYQSAVTIIQNMVDGLCASIPYHLGHPMPHFEEAERFHPFGVEQMSLDDSDRPRYRAEPADTERSVKTLGAYYLLLPLLFCYSTPTLPETQRAWLRGRLVHIGSHHGSAKVLAELSPTNIRNGRIETVTDYAPPPYEPYPDVFEFVHSPSFRSLEAIAELQATTAEARVFRAWRAGFVERLLDM
jgi:hypothetical protein